MKVLAYKLFLCLIAVALLLVSVSNLISVYARFADDDDVDVFYLAEVDATCVATTLHGKAVMSCLEGKRLKESE